MTVDTAVEVITVVGLVEVGFMLNSRLIFSIRGFWVVVVIIEDRSTRSNKRFSKSFCWQLLPLTGWEEKSQYFACEILQDKKLTCCCVTDVSQWIALTLSIKLFEK